MIKYVVDLITMDNLIKELEKIKKTKELTYESIAQDLGISFNTVYRWLKGKNNPSHLAEDKIRDFISRS